MRLILDTHTLLWFLAGDPRLSAQARNLIADMGNQVATSVASLWEIVIKVSLGKLTLASPFAELIPEQLARNDIDVLPITIQHLATLGGLPFHHRDPFDRLIIAQAISEGLPVVTSDARFSEYGQQVLW
jgi:PIN domain nuclease of toxin-antitoxin system